MWIDVRRERSGSGLGGGGVGQKLQGARIPIRTKTNTKWNESSNKSRHLAFSIVRVKTLYMVLNAQCIFHDL
jgi:hypothetical protein